MNNILIIPNPYVENVDNVISEVTSNLAPLKWEIFPFPLKKREMYQKLEEMLPNFDLVITLGGDGSMLKIVELIYKYDVSLLGINYGGVGYLTSLKKDELSKLKRLNNGEYYIDQRGLLDVSIKDKDYHHVCLNDVVIFKSNINIPIKLKVVSGDAKEYFADGIIISTATGSTAYSYSAGSPIIEEGKIILTPICPVSRSSSYSIYDDNVAFKITSIRDNRDRALVSVDGSDQIDIDKNDLIIVKKALKKLNIVRFDHD